MRQIFENYETVKYGTVLAFLVTIMASGIYGALSGWFQKYGIPIFAFTWIVIYYVLRKYRRKIGIFLKEVSFEERNKEVRYIHNNFERRIRDVYPVEIYIKLATWGGQLTEFIVGLLVVGISFAAAIYLPNYLPVGETLKKVIIASSVIFVFIFVFLWFVNTYLPSKLAQHFDYTAEIAWKPRSSWENCYTIFNTKDNIVIIRYYGLGDYAEILRILQDSGFSYIDEGIVYLQRQAIRQCA